MMKLGRNDMCYCDSGIKYKKCHLIIGKKPVSSFTVPPFEHKIVHEGKISEGYSHGNNEIVRFVKPTGRGMSGNKYLEWLDYEFGGVESVLFNRFAFGLESHNRMMVDMFDTDDGRMETPYTYTLGYVELKSNGKYEKAPFVFYKEGGDVLIPARDVTVNLNKLEYSITANAISTNTLGWVFQKELGKNGSVYKFGSIGLLKADKLSKWDNILRLYGPSLLGNSESASKIWRILD